MNMKRPINTSLDEELLDLIRKTDEGNNSAEPELFSEQLGYPKMELIEIQDPVLSYKLYHMTIEKLLRKYLRPVSDKRVVRAIRDQKNLYLKNGKLRGADGKMARTSRMQKLAHVIIEWVNINQGQNLTDLYFRLVDLNNENSKEEDS
jgi:hypothetical protein